MELPYDDYGLGAQRSDLVALPHTIKQVSVFRTLL